MDTHTPTSLASYCVDHARLEFEFGDAWMGQLEDFVCESCDKYKTTEEERDHVMIGVNRLLFGGSNGII